MQIPDRRQFAPSVVKERARGLISQSWQSQANLSFFLLLIILLAFILPSLGFGRHDLRLYGDIAFSISMISGVAIAWGRPTLFWTAGFVASGAIALRWMAWLHPTQNTTLWSEGWGLVAIIAIAVVLLSEVFRSGPVTTMRVQGAIAIYLLFGVGWANAYHIANIVNPGSLKIPSGEFSGVSDWFYYSFVTLSTVGYGDIVPVSPVARTLAIAEALTGQLYLAVLIARLVAMEVITWQSLQQDKS